MTGHTEGSSSQKECISSQGSAVAQASWALWLPPQCRARRRSPPLLLLRTQLLTLQLLQPLLLPPLQQPVTPDAQFQDVEEGQRGCQAQQAAPRTMCFKGWR